MNSNTAVPTNHNFNTQLFDLASNIQDISKKKNWVACYDKESDSLTISEKNLPSEVSIKYLNSEIAVFETPKEDIKGLFIEYFTKNFLSHTNELADLKKQLSEKRNEVGSNDNDAFVKVQKGKLNELLQELQEDLHDLVINNMTITAASAFR
jgi:hypothetical protein